MIHSKDKFDEMQPAGFDGVFDWDFLLPAFAPTKIEPMDWDAVIERKGHFLVFETKHPGQVIPLGQEITLKQAVIQGRGKYTVYVLYGKNPVEINSMEIWYLDNGVFTKRFYDNCTADDVLWHTGRWFEFANSQP